MDMCCHKVMETWLIVFRLVAPFFWMSRAVEFQDVDALAEDLAQVTDTYLCECNDKDTDDIDITYVYIYAHIHIHTI